MVRVAIAGAGGRMGQALVEATLASSDLALASAFDVAQSPLIGRDAGERFGANTGVAIAVDSESVLHDADVLIDFTRPEGTLKHLQLCAKAGVGAVIGTTGFDAAQKAAIASHARSVPIVFAANMSVGVNVLVALTEQAARMLGADFDIEIVEMHHKHKVDAPSGTALWLGEAAARGAGVDLDQHGVYERHGVTGERKQGAIGFATLRGGDVVGEHSVVFAGAGERIELTHRATSRQNFAVGALRAARFVAQLRSEGKRGLHGMTDVLGLGGSHA